MREDEKDFFIKYISQTLFSKRVAASMVSESGRGRQRQIREITILTDDFFVT